MVDPTIRDETRLDIKVPVGDLKIGMFVSALDRDWLGTPFKLQGFYVRERSDIDKLNEYCSYVYVLGIGNPLSRRAEHVSFASGELIGRKPQKYETTSSLGNEFERAKKVVSNARAFVNQMLVDVALGGAVSLDKAKAVVVESVESVIRHPDAAAFATRLRGLDDYTSEHCMNVCMLSIVFGRKLGLKKQQLINLGLCGLLHDAGKARVPPEVLNKPGRLTAEEFEIMKQHTTLGFELLSEKKDTYQGALEVAHSHHERPDGRGYPRGLEEDRISLFTKIVSIVDAYDAITGDRVYAKGRPSTEALRILFEGAGQQFDKKLALAFIQTIGIYPPGVVVELVNGMIGIVTDTQNAPKHLPDVLIVLDAQKKPVQNRYVYLADTVDERSQLSRDYLIKTTLPDGCYGVSVKDFFHRGVFERLES